MKTSSQEQLNVAPAQTHNKGGNMENPITAREVTHVEGAQVPAEPIQKKQSSLKFFFQSIRGHFLSSEMKFEDWQKLESKKQITRSEHRENHYMRFH